MRAWLIIGWVFLLPGLLRASPVPPPPDDFSGAQYIDGAGCVHLRSGTAWQPRLDGDGAPLCGFPPSLPAGDANTAPVQSAQERLAEMLATDLQQGEWVADPKPAAERRDPAPLPGDDRLARDVATSLHVSAGLSATAATVVGGDKVCGLLGYAPTGRQERALGQDVTLGLCPGMRADLPTPQVVAANTAVRPVADQTPVQPAAKPRATVSPQAAPARPAVRQRVELAKDRTEAQQPEMIPATARFVRVGAFVDDANATLVARKLSAMGYSVGQRYEQRAGQRVRAIMAGPFTDRQALIAALNRIRGNGYPAAVAR